MYRDSSYGARYPGIGGGYGCSSFQDHFRQIWLSSKIALVSLRIFIPSRCSCTAALVPILLFDGMASLSSLWTVLLDAASRHTPAAAQRRLEGEQVFALIFHQSDLPAESTPVADMADLVRRMTAGMAVLLMDGCDRGIAFSVQNLKFRSVGEPEGGGKPSWIPGRFQSSAAHQPQFAAPADPHRSLGAGGSAGGYPYGYRVCAVLL